MVNRIITRIILGASQQLKPGKTIFGNTLQRSFSTNDIPVKEVNIPVQYGHLAAKLWGSGSQRPILAVHGWQDNASTWDTLIPLLYKDLNNRPILAIDFPGHGLSSWFPPGMHYYAWEYPRFIYYLKEYFNWDKVSILGHSMGSIAGFRFSCIFPEDVDFYIAIDSLIYDDYDLNLVVGKYPQLLKKNHISQGRLDIEPPSYALEEIIKIWHLGTHKSVSLESVPHLLKRGAKQSSKDPNKYYFSRDPRLKYVLFNPEDKKFVEAMALRLKCPTLYIKAVDSPYASDQFSVAMRETIEKNHDKFETQFLPGTHHLHLNNPEVVAPQILKFLSKYKFLETKV